MAGDGAQVGKAYVRVLPDTKGFGKELESQVDRESSGLGKVFGGIGKAAGAAFALGSVAAVGAGVAMYKIGTQTQEALNIFEAAAHATGDEMERVSALARDLGNDVQLPGTSAATAAVAMSELAKAGLSVDESMAAAKGTLQLAAAAGVDAATAATIAGNSLNAFGLDASEAGRVADLLAGAANSASGEITDVAQALQQSGSVYASAGIKIEDLTTAIAEMANQGILGSDAGTSLKTMLLSLQAPSKKAQGVLEELGVSVYDANGNMKSLRDIIGQFNEPGALPALTQNQRDAALATIFGTDAVRAANIVLGQGVEGFDAMKASVTEAGAAQKIAEARMKGLGGAVEGLKSQLETLALDGFNLLAPYAEAFVRWLSDQLPGAVKKAGDALGWFRDHVIVPIVVWFQKNWPTIQRVAGEVAAKIVQVWQEKLVPAFEAVWDALQTGFEWLLDHKAVLIGAILAISAVLVGPFVTAVAAAVVAYTKFEGVREAIDSVVTWLQTTALPAVQQVWGWITENTGLLAQYISERWADIQTAIDNVVTYLKVVVAIALAPVLLIWQAAHDQIVGLVKIAWEQVRVIIETTLGVIKGIIDVFLGLLSGDWGRAWDGIKSIVDNIWNLIKSTIQGGVDAAILIVQGGLNVLAAVWGLAWNGIQTALSTVWETLKNIISGAINAIVGFFESLPGRILGALGGLASQLYEKGRDAGASFARGVADALKSAGISIGLGALFGPIGAIVGQIVDKHAAGGVFTQPHLGVVAEAGPEAIIPLNNRARAQQVMYEAGLAGPAAPAAGTVVNISGVASDPQTLGRIVADELTWTYRTRVA